MDAHSNAHVVRWRRPHRWLLLIVCLALCALAAYRIGYVSIFMFDAERKAHAYQPPVRDFDNEDMRKPFFDRHNCFTCYVIAAHLATEGVDNLYDRSRYRGAENETPVHETVGDVLTVDTYQYPPPFLLLPRLLMLGGHDFFQLRTAWFVVNVVVFCLAAGMLVGWVGGWRFTPHWLAIPYIVTAPVMLGALQIGNVHILIVCLALMGILLLEQRWYGVGGALLGFTIVAKLFPGVLLAYLLFRRRWRAFIWTGSWIAVFCLLTLAVFGPKPFEAFVSYQMPRLASGDAFAFAQEHIRPLTVNSSVIGAAYKAEALGWLGEDAADTAATALTWLHTVLLLVAIAVSGHRQRRVNVGKHTAPSTARGVEPIADAASPYDELPVRLALARVWLALLILGQLRSPFLPWSYGNVAVLWLAVMLLPADRFRMWHGLGLLAAWALYGVMVPLPAGPPVVTVDLTYTLVTTTVLVAACLAVIGWHAFRLPHAPQPEDRANAPEAQPGFA